MCKVINIVHSIVNTDQGNTAEHYAKCSDSLTSDYFPLGIKQVHFHAWIQDFFRGGGGSGPGRFFSPQLILQFTEGGRWFYYRENYTLEGVQHFPGGSNFFQGGGGPNVNFYRNPYNL